MYTITTRDGKRHELVDLPIMYKRFYNQLMSIDDEPAVVDHRRGIKKWFMVIDGKSLLSRLTGPAIVVGTEENPSEVQFFIYGERMTEDEFKKHPAVIKHQIETALLTYKVPNTESINPCNNKGGDHEGRDC